VISLQQILLLLLPLGLGAQDGKMYFFNILHDPTTPKAQVLGPVALDINGVLLGGPLAIVYHQPLLEVRALSGTLVSHSLFM